jgi:catechol 2,3-dioxygenase-like lactoylglutathione lyase family enzyme
MKAGFASVLVLVFAAALTAQQKERVEGIGGFFFKAKSPKTLAQWYTDHLGVGSTPTEYGNEPWTQTAGSTAFQPFPATTTYFGRAGQTFMLNFRVRNLDAMVAQLRRADIKVDVDPETYPNGRFARLEDPEGNPIQLWEPKGKKQ